MVNTLPRQHSEALALGILQDHVHGAELVAEAGNLSLADPDVGRDLGPAALGVLGQRVQPLDNLGNVHADGAQV